MAIKGEKIRMKYAVIDIGTNSVLMLVAEKSETGVVKTIVDLADITRLGEGVNKTKMLKCEAMDRTLKRFTCMQTWLRG